MRYILNDEDLAAIESAARTIGSCDTTIIGLAGECERVEAMLAAMKQTIKDAEKTREQALEMRDAFLATFLDPDSIDEGCAHA